MGNNGTEDGHNFWYSKQKTNRDCNMQCSLQWVTCGHSKYRLPNVTAGPHSRIQLQGKLSLLALRWGKLWNFHSNVSTTDVTFLGIKPYCCSLMVISLQQLFITASWHGSSDLSPSSYYSYAHNLSWKSVLLHSSGILTFKNCAKQTG